MEEANVQPVKSPVTVSTTKRIDSQSTSQTIKFPCLTSGAMHRRLKNGHINDKRSTVLLYDAFHINSCHSSPSLPLPLYKSNCPLLYCILSYQPTVTAYLTMQYTHTVTDIIDTNTADMWGYSRSVLRFLRAH